jgi:hypothetical protein
MWVLAFFRAEKFLGRLAKILIFAAALALLCTGLVAVPQSDVEIAIALAALVILWWHGYRDSARVSHAAEHCVVEVREDERRIRVVGGGVDFVLRLASKTLNVNRVAKPLISSDAPGEFQRLRSGSFNWPFHLTVSDHAPDVVSTNIAANDMRWSAATVESTDLSANDATATRARAGECEISVRWTHPGHGDRLLFSVAGPAGKYEAIERAFVTFAAWIEQEEAARLAIERRHDVELWQREWESSRLAEEVAQTRGKNDGKSDGKSDGGTDARSDSNIGDPHPPMLARATLPAASRRW